ncbi:MAG: FHA domain-containing protein [Deltaproteobacteria bacterium]|nr:FHA domain-containing protein [Deltaproteobacteria bacterium]
MAELFILNGRKGGTVFLLAGDRTLVGRSPECTVCVDDSWISSRHAYLEMRGGQLWVVDLDSRNGTYVGEEQVREARLKDGDRVSFGRTEAKVRLTAARPASRALPPGATMMRVLAHAPPPRAPAAPAAPGPTPPPGLTPPPAPRPPPAPDAGRRQVAVLHAIARSLSEAAGLGDGLQRMLEALAEALRAPRALLLMPDEHGEMAPKAHLPPPPGPPPRHSATIVEAAIQARAGIISNDAQADARFAQAGSIFMENIRSALCVPIWAEQRVLGALLFDRHIGDPFQEEELELATVAAYQVALAIERERFLEHSRVAEAQRRKLLRHFSPDVAALVLAQEEQAADDPLAPQVRDGVTILFSDVRGFTRMTERLPALELAQLLREYFHQMTLAVFEERGTLDKFIGDGLMAIFGAPVAQPDGPLRAVRCASLMLARLQALNERLPADRQIAIRIGVNTGRVVAGSLGSPERMEFTVLGDAVNVASRLESIAGPSSVLVGRATFEATQHAFRYRELGPQQVKGREAKVEAFELLGPR